MPYLILHFNDKPYARLFIASERVTLKSIVFF